MFTKIITLNDIDSGTLGNKTVGDKINFFHSVCGDIISGTILHIYKGKKALRVEF